MTWFKVDDGLHSHRKWLATSMAARGLWVTAGAWCADQLTDGHIPTHVLRQLGGRPRDAIELVANGLWDSLDDGWRFHGWDDFQPSREAVEAERAAARERQRRAREKAKQKRDLSRRDSRRESHASNGASHGPPDPTRPIDITKGGMVTNEPRDDEPPPRRCNEHSGLAAAPPCGACAEARRAHDAWQAEHGTKPTPRDAYAEQREAALAKAAEGQAKVRAIANEPLDPTAAERIAALRNEHHLSTNAWDEEPF